jgi:hypothetical protein
MCLNYLHLHLSLHIFRRKILVSLIICIVQVIWPKA